MSMPTDGGIGDLGAEENARERRDVPRDERRADRREPVAADVGPAQPSKVGDRECERLVGEEVGHDCAPAEADATHPRRQRRGVEQVTGVEERGQENDPGPRQATGDIPDRRELGGAGEDDRAHRHRLDGREAGLAGRQPVDEPEPRRRDADPERVRGELAAARGQRRDWDLVQRRKVFPQVPSHTT